MKTEIYDRNQYYNKQLTLFPAYLIKRRFLIHAQTKCIASKLQMSDWKFQFGISGGGMDENNCDAF